MNEGNPKSLKNLTSSIRGSNKIERSKTEEGVEITEQTEILNEFRKWYKKSIESNLSETDKNRLIEEQNDYVEFHSRLKKKIKKLQDMKSESPLKNLIKTTHQVHMV